MKRKLALLLAGAMVVTAVPMTSFASSENKISKVVSGKEDVEYKLEDGCYLFLKTKGDFSANGDTFILTLTNAEWNMDYDNNNEGKYDAAALKKVGTITDAGTAEVSYKKLTAKQAMFTAKGMVELNNTDEGYLIPLVVTLKDDGDATVTIDPVDSAVSAGTYTFATVSSGDTTTTIEKVEDMAIDDEVEIKPIVITEVVPGSLKKGTLKLKVSGDYTFSGTPKAEIVTGDGKGTFAQGTVNGVINKNDDTIEFDFEKGEPSETSKIKIVISGITVEDDESDAGDIATITVSGCGITKATVDAAKTVDYGVTFKAEDADVPTIFSGRDNGDVDLLKVTIKETAPNSWWTGRKTTITLPEGVKFIDAELTDSDKVDESKSDKKKIEINDKDRRELEITGFYAQEDKKMELELQFTVETAPDFTGDVVASLGGPSIDGTLEATVAKVVAPVTVTADAQDVSIDYRKVTSGDITITENEAGALPSNSTVTLKLDKIDFDATPEIEVVEGDIKIDKVEKDGNLIKIKIKSASSKTPAVLKLTGNSLYLDRTIPVGNYALKLAANVDEDLDGKTLTNPDFVDNAGDIEIIDYTDEYIEEDPLFASNANDAKTKTAGFDCDSVTVVEDYVTVVTAGRDQDDSSFTTTLVITADATTMKTGKEEITLDVPAFINSDGYMMLPVRAIVEALSGVAAIKWDDASKTAFFNMGSRNFSMTVGKNVMNIMGIDVPMNTPAIIKDERIFIPVRDLGYALGLTDEKIVWDEATRTATLN